MKRLMMAIAAALMVGCGEREAAKPAKAVVPKGERTYEQMATNDVIVVANGKALTKGAVELQVAIQAELAKIANPDIKLSALERLTEMNRRRAEKLFVEQQAMLAEAARRGIKLTEEDRREIHERFAKGVLKGKAKYGLLMGKLDDEKRTELDDALGREKLVQMALAAVREECRVTVSEAEAAKKFKELEAYNARAKAEEAQIWKSASNAWERIQGGEDFEKTAERCKAASEHVNSDMDWGEFEPDFFKDDVQLGKFLAVMPVGTVAPPVPGDNGILIVKMLERIPVDFGTGRLKPHYRLAKIFFELPEYYPLETADALKAELEKTRTDAAAKKRVAALVAGVKLEYPNGKVALTPKRTANNILKVNKGKEPPTKEKQL